MKLCRFYSDCNIIRFRLKNIGLNRITLITITNEKGLHYYINDKRREVFCDDTSTLSYDEITEMCKNKKEDECIKFYYLDKFKRSEL